MSLSIDLLSPHSLPLPTTPLVRSLTRRSRPEEEEIVRAV